MKAIYIKDHGNLDVLQYAEIDDPILMDGQVLVKIKAAGINHLDIWVRKGLPNTRLPLPLVLGLRWLR